MKCRCKYYFIILFIQIISVFHATWSHVYLTSIFAESFLAITAVVCFCFCFFPFGILDFFLNFFKLFLDFLQTAVMGFFDFCFYHNCKSQQSIWFFLSQRNTSKYKFLRDQNLEIKRLDLSGTWFITLQCFGAGSSVSWEQLCKLFKLQLWLQWLVLPDKRKIFSFSSCGKLRNSI